MEEEVMKQRQLILDMRQKMANDEAVIEEMKLQVGLREVLSHSTVCGQDSINLRPHTVCSCRRPRLADGGTLVLLDTFENPVWSSWPPALHDTSYTHESGAN